MLSRELVEQSPGWRPEATGLPPGAVRAPVMGFDLVRNEFGGWRVLEDNVRNPSGAAYAIAIRDLMDQVLPDLPRPDGLLDPATALRDLRECLLAHAGAGRDARPCCPAARTARPGSSTGCSPSAAGCGWWWPTTSRWATARSGTGRPATGWMPSTCGSTSSWST